MSRLLLSTLVGTLLCAALTGCSGKSTPATPETKSQVDPNLVTISKELQSTIKVGAVGQRTLVDTLRIPGRIQVDEQFESRAGAPVTGRISSIAVKLGDTVKAGQTLASIKSTELAQYQLSYIKASQQMLLQSKAVERAKQLLEADVISMAELQRRESELSGAIAELNAARDQLLVLGMSAGDIGKLGIKNSGLSISNIHSKISGTVIERKARLGQVVAPAEELFVVADLSRVWAVAEIPEQQISHVSKGQSINIEVPALAHTQITGTLAFVGDTVNPETRTITARANLSNPQKALKPDMLISMLLSASPESVTAVPATAVVRENNADFVFVQMPTAQQFRLMPVTLGRSFEGHIEVKDGLTQGDVIVLDGAFHVNNERKRKEME